MVDIGATELFTQRFVNMTVELSHAESYVHELSIQRCIATNALHELGLSYQEISDLYTQRGVAISRARVQQLVERGAARERLKAEMNGKMSGKRKDTIPQ